MEMKDKLVKFGHKKPYYVARKAGIVSLACIGIISMIAIPTYIGVSYEIKAQTKAQEEKERLDENKEEIIEEESLLHY